MNNRRVAVIGAGITGLTAAYRLQSGKVPVDVYEASPRLGGSIRTLEMGSCKVDVGPSGVLASRESVVKLVHDLNLSHDWVQASSASNKRFIYYRGELREVPTSLPKLLTSGWIPWSAKWRIVTEFFRRARTQGHATELLADFIERRFGRFVADVMVDAMVSGIHGAPARLLEAQAAFPILPELEREHGTIIGGMVKLMRARRRQIPQNTAQLKGMLNLSGGFESLIAALAQDLSNIRLNEEVRAVIKEDAHHWNVQSSSGTKSYTDVLLTTTADVASQCLKESNRLLSDALGQIQYTPLINVILHFEERVPTPQGFGYLNPGMEERSMLGCLFLHHVFPELIPQPNTVFRAFLGGQRAKDQMEYDDDMLVSLAKDELEDVLNLKLPAPKEVKVLRWPTSVAFYEQGTGKRWDSIDHLLEQEPGLQLGGNWYQGVSVADCISRGETLARNIMEPDAPNTKT